MMSVNSHIILRNLDLETAKCPEGGLPKNTDTVDDSAPLLEISFEDKPYCLNRKQILHNLYQTKISGSKPKLILKNLNLEKAKCPEGGIQRNITYITADTKIFV